MKGWNNKQREAGLRTRQRRSIANNLDDAYIPEPNTGCWIWTRGVKSSNIRVGGYGVLRSNGKVLEAPRYFWTMRNGPVPDGLWVLHKCDTPICVNPDHLFLGTNRDNILDSVRKKRRYMPTPPTTKLSRQDALEIRRLYATGKYTMKEVGAKFHVGTTNVCWIVHNKTWKE